jgi:3-deoxy-D-manno-octulosonate 8-phosphate phosphatase (KDO 8-P phosphatase)
MMYRKIEKPSKPKLFWDRIKLLVLDCDGVLTDGRIIYGCGGEELKNFDAHDGMGFLLMRQTPLQAAVITGRSSTALEKRCQDLGIKFLFQGVANKLQKLNELLQELHLTFENVVYVGDDWNDIPCMHKAAGSMCPSDAVADIRALTDIVLHNAGGRGAVRECIEMILRNQGIYDQAVAAYLAQCG